MKNERTYTIREWARKTHLDSQPELLFSGKTKSDFNNWKREFESKFFEMLGEFPKSVSLRAEVLDRKEFKTYIREKVVFDSEKHMSVPAWICVPKSRKRGEKLPAALCCHGHGLGKDPLVEIDADGNEGRKDYMKGLAIRLAESGYVAIAPDWRGFGERIEPPETHPRPRDLCNLGNLASQALGYNLLTLNIWDGIRTIDYLATRKEVDMKRLGCVGVSFGGTMSLFLSAVDQRISVSCISGYLAETGYWGGCGSQALPGLLKYADRAEIGGLACPNPMLIQVGEYDSTFPANSAMKEFKRLQRIYKAAQAEDKLALDFFDGCHEINVGPIIDWFDKWL